MNAWETLHISKEKYLNSNRLINGQINFESDKNISYSQRTEKEIRQRSNFSSGKNYPLAW